jgi:hypothetical protein
MMEGSPYEEIARMHRDRIRWTELLGGDPGSYPHSEESDVGRVRAAIKWCKTDMAYKAPEQITVSYLCSLFDHVCRALDTEEPAK